MAPTGRQSQALGARSLESGDTAFLGEWEALGGGREERGREWAVGGRGAVRAQVLLHPILEV